MWALIDNYDSFTYILHHYLLALHPDVRVWQNDAISVEELKRLGPERIILSPGPQRPEQAGITKSLIPAFYRDTPILGICLGHQALGQFFGAQLVKAAQPVHGKTSPLIHQNSSVFRDLPNGFPVMRYHSLVLEDWEDTGISPLAFTPCGTLMAFAHPLHPCMGFQFHPESILTEYGMYLLEQWAALPFRTDPDTR